MRQFSFSVGSFPERREGVEPWSESSARAGLTAELELFEPLDGLALVGDNLSLPDQRDGHAAHGDDTKEENKADAGFLGGKVEHALKPSHGKGSPSTRFSLHDLFLANPSWQRRGHRDCQVELAQSRGQDFAGVLNRLSYGK